MTVILGVSGYYHDSAAALLVDGRIAAAAQEERFSRVKHDHRLPVRAMAYCLDEAGLAPQDVDYVGFYERPFLKFDRLLQTYVTYAPAGFRPFIRAMPLWLRQKLHIPSELRRSLPGYTQRFVYIDHHESHAASAFFPSPFEEAAVLTLDGVGEWATGTVGVGRGNQIELLAEQRFPHSLGLLYSAFTYYAGFRVNSGEYKLMGLAPYGRPVYAERILEKLMDLRDDGSFRLDMDYFNYCQGLTMTSERFHRLFGGAPRRPESAIGEREMDLAASIQQVTEEIMVRAARHANDRTGVRSLCLAGGVALNCVGNARILRDGPFDRIWIQPAAGDAGGALGVALFIWHQLLGNERQPEPGDSQRGSLLGPRYHQAEICEVLDRLGAAFSVENDEVALCDQVADMLAAGKVVGWFHGRMEFGPRALGARSILGDARDPSMQSVMNRKIKFRESFRPFAPAVLVDHVDEWFERTNGEESPYMLLVAPVRRDRELPAVTHVDGSARLQTVDAARHGRFHTLLERFYRRTGCPVLINTSFNVRGEPIVCTPEEAYRCFMATDMDVLVLEGAILRKEEQDGAAPIADTVSYLAQFALD